MTSTVGEPAARTATLPSPGVPRHGRPRDAADADARHCAGIVRTHARTFTLASHLLPPEKRRAAFALYAFCRLADDIVDLGPAALAAQRLAEVERQLDATLAGHPTGPVFREVRRALDRYDVPAGALHELLAGVARDLAWAPYATWAELVTYCEGVASSVGEMCMHVFGVVRLDDESPDATAARALHHARTLGVAMQLTNILRDVGEDARRGRCYLPLEDLAAHGLTSAEVLGDRTLGRDPRWRALMAFQVARARALYADALPGIALLAPDARRCAAACAHGYAAFLDAIAAAGYDTIADRPRVGTAARLGILWRCWRDRDALHGTDRVAPRDTPRDADRDARATPAPAFPAPLPSEPRSATTV